MEKISIIIPVYKVEQYLEECLDSVINQTYKNLKIIIVDDCSPDNCGEICDRYLSDERVTVLHLPQNAGLDIADTKYVTFLDSDDYILPDHIENLYSNMMEYNSDIAVCDYVVFDDVYDKKEKRTHLEHTSGRCIDKREALVLLYKRKLETNVWNKLYHTKSFEKIRFPEGKNYEDVYVMQPLIANSEKISFTGSEGYCYRMRADSITHDDVFNTQHLEAINLQLGRIIADENLEEHEKKICIGINNEIRMHVIYKLLYAQKTVRDRESLKRIWKENRKSITLSNPKLWLKTRFPRIYLVLIGIKRFVKRVYKWVEENHLK
ncbi:MAG: glycosyltransferase family 2 protein [Ruminococcaceae bacterium]|nr:glycosyltransferase family 2 protein [Oscillospiraceae bacterium]